MSHPEKIGPAQPETVGAKTVVAKQITEGAVDTAETRPLQIFGCRCQQMAARVAAGEVPFIWAIDCCYDAAVASGLSDSYGDDKIQKIMGRAFMGTRS